MQKIKKLKKILIINTSGIGDLMFTEPIARQLEELKLSYEVKHWTGLLNVQELNHYDAVFISASPKGDNLNFYDRLKAFHWLKTFQDPVFGICAGHQLTGVSFGARLIRNFQAEEGLVEINIENRDIIFEGMDNKLIGEQHHSDSISLPENFDLLASSEKCDVQAIRHREKPIYTFQWHVEISNPELIRNFIEIFL